MEQSLKGKNVLITGGAGFIGSHLVERVLRDNPAGVTVVDNFFLGSLKNLDSAMALRNDIRVMRSDASDYSSMENIVRAGAVDVLFNLAVIPLPTSLVHPMWTVKTNYDIALSACELIKLGRVGTLVHCSSSEAYGTARYVPMDEEHPLVPCTPYAASKAAEDQLVLSYANTFGIDARIVRPFNNYGPRQNHREYAGIIPIVVKKVLSGEPVEIYGSGDQTRDYVFVRDTADAIVSAHSAEAARNQVINIGTGTETSIKSLVSQILEVMDRPHHRIVHHDKRPGDVDRHCASTAKAAKLLSYEPRPLNRETLTETVDWYVRELS